MVILITGGAGFIGKRLAISLRNSHHQVAVFDNLHPQVHPAPDCVITELKRAGVIFVRGNIIDLHALTETIIDVKPDVVIHLAAETGTGQSYEMPRHYCEVNVTGTAQLIEAIRIAGSKGIKVRRIILAGSRAVYGEGACIDAKGQEVTAVPRLPSNLAAGDYAPKDSDGNPLTPIASRAKTTAPAPASVYASTKLMQEYLLRQALDGVEVAVLRLQNVYGSGQSLHNPYTGVLSIFTQQLLDGKRLNIFEDGEIVRDFVHVSDVVTAFHCICEMKETPSIVIDIGSGRGCTILQVAKFMSDLLGLQRDCLVVSGQFRPGDVRHAVADLQDARHLLGWAPRISIDEGLKELVEWASRP